MADVLLVDLFVEDQAHEALLRPLIQRIAAEETIRVEVHPRSARGGHARVLEELGLYQKNVEDGVAGLSKPDVLVACIDANCDSHSTAKGHVTAAVRPAFEDLAVIACPDPHVERWYLGDPTSFGTVVGKQPTVGRRKCRRDEYKRILAETVAAAGHPVLLGGTEFAPEIVAAMDLYRAGKREPSLKHFVGDLRAAFKRAKAAAD